MNHRHGWSGIRLQAPHFRWKLVAQSGVCARARCICKQLNSHDKIFVPFIHSSGDGECSSGAVQCNAAHMVTRGPCDACRTRIIAAAAGHFARMSSVSLQIDQDSELVVDARRRRPTHTTMRFNGFIVVLAALYC